MNMHQEEPKRLLRLAALAIAVATMAISTFARADDPTPYPGTQVIKTPHSFATLTQRLEKAIEANGMGLVAQASASRGAASRGVSIPGNLVLMVFRNDYAVRMLATSVPAGIEAPLRLYVTENADGTATLTYRTPSAVFAPYGNAALDAMAKELDPIFAKIVSDASAK
jgi:uncharacterized protein (DUF302 family)